MVCPCSDKPFPLDEHSIEHHSKQVVLLVRETIIDIHVYMNALFCYRRRRKDKNHEGSASCCPGLADHGKANNENNHIDDDGYASVDHSQGDPDEIIDHYAEVGAGLTVAKNENVRDISGPDTPKDGRGRRRPDIKTRDYTADLEARRLEAATDGHHVITEGGDVYAVPGRKRKSESVEVLENEVYGEVDSIDGND